MAHPRMFYFILNTYQQKLYRKLLKELSQYTSHYKIYLTDNIPQLHHLFAHLKEKLKAQDVIVAVGGDGTLNQIITQVRNHQIVNDIAILPAGTGNDFARSNHLPLNFDEALIYLFEEAQSTSKDLLQITGPQQQYYAVNSMGVGLDGRIIHQIASRRVSQKIYAHSYSQAIIGSFLKQKRFKLTLHLAAGDQIFEGAQLFTLGTNKYFGGGIPILTHADNEDGLLDLIIGHHVNFSRLLTILAKLLWKGAIPKSPHLWEQRLDAVKFSIDDTQFAQYDGEPFTIYPEEKWQVTLLKQNYWI